MRCLNFPPKLRLPQQIWERACASVCEREREKGKVSSAPDCPNFGFLSDGRGRLVGGSHKSSQRTGTPHRKRNIFAPNPQPALRENSTPFPPKNEKTSKGICTLQFNTDLEGALGSRHRTFVLVSGRHRRAGQTPEDLNDLPAPVAPPVQCTWALVFD